MFFANTMNRIEDITSFDHSIQEYWKDNNLYASLVNSNPSQSSLFRFCDGPPFVSANTLHFGHLLVGYIKDMILRWNTMHGINSLNKLGYDCHGLPMEMLAYKLLGLKNNADVESLGIKNFNEFCKQTVVEYSGNWNPIYDRIGRMHDQNDTYKTMDKEFMESVWWIFKQLWNKGLVLREYEVMPFSIKCSTPLSNFEAGSNYKEVETESAFVLFPLKKDPNINFVAWTTTPWTLLSNIALAVNPNALYVALTDKKGKKYIVCETCVEASGIKYASIEKYALGSEIIGEEYIPPFNVLNRDKYCVIQGDFVTTKEIKKDKKDNDDESHNFIGTGIVHIAPAHGKEDFDASINANIINAKDVETCCIVNNEGIYTCGDYKDMEVFEANGKIIIDLKEKGIILRTMKLKHSYPHCPRTDTPLIYKIVKSFFIDVPQIKDKLVEANKKIKWVPEVIGSNRFNNWIKDAKRWGVSRQRYFGTPIPVFISDDGEEMECFGSIAELEEVTNMKFNDIHPEFLMNIGYKSKSGRIMHLSLDCLDCWFESGAVPFAQYHYPFNPHTRDFVESGIRNGYLCDFIAEGLDQTRGWFYTLLVISVALFDVPPAKTILCTGLVLDENGVKFSKRYGNFKDPMEELDKYGADTLRLYLLSSPAVRAEPLRFTDKFIKQLQMRITPWIHAINFYTEYRTAFDKKGNIFIENAYEKATNICDQWILTRISTLIADIEKYMGDYQIDRATSNIIDFIDDLTNWYIKLNRERLKGNEGVEEQTIALSVLLKVIDTFNTLSAPFMPFTAEKINMIINNDDDNYQSIFLNQIQNPLICYNTSFPLIQKTICMIRKIRDRSKDFKSVKKPIKSITIVTDNDSKIGIDERYIIGETNVIAINYKSLQDYKQYKITLNNKAVGKKYGKNLGDIKQYIQNMNQEMITKFYDSQQIETEYGILINNEDYTISSTHDFSTDKDENNQQIAIDNDIVIIADLTMDEDTMLVYDARLFINRIQNKRKENGLHSWDEISIEIDKNAENYAVFKYKQLITERLKTNISFTEFDMNNDDNNIENYDLSSNQQFKFKMHIINRNQNQSKNNQAQMA